MHFFSICCVMAQSTLTIVMWCAANTTLSITSSDEEQASNVPKPPTPPLSLRNRESMSPRQTSSSYQVPVSPPPRSRESFVTSVSTSNYVAFIFTVTNNWYVFHIHVNLQYSMQLLLCFFVSFKQCIKTAIFTFDCLQFIDFIILSIVST